VTVWCAGLDGTPVGVPSKPAHQMVTYIE